LFLKEEDLGGENKSYCKKCEKNVEVKKKLSIWKLPNILIIHLKKYGHNKGKLMKINTNVNFKFNYNFETICEGKCKKTPDYSLFSICSHQGHLNEGHYKSYAMNIDD